MKKCLMLLTAIIYIGLALFFGCAEVFAVDEAEIYIKAINPGYTVDGKANVGEVIEISRRGSDEMISLAGIAVSYTNSSGNSSIIFEFPENSFFVGETLLLRLASSPGSELASSTYTKTLAFAAGLELKRGEEVLDKVCWTGKDGCLREFKSANPTSLVRNMETLEFEHVKEYEPIYDKENYLVKAEPEEERKSQCRGLVFSEILSYYESSRSEQFIEVYNLGSEQILMNGCKIRYKNKNYELQGVIGPEKYFSYLPLEFSLTKNPTNSGVLELIDTNDDVLDKLEYPNGQRKGTSYALIGFNEFGEEIWRTTYRPTPGEANHYQEFKTCEEGKVINLETGNCVKVTSVAEKICGEGQYLNVLTGRCRKIEVASEKICKEGYELNPETGRCRKIKENTGAEYSLEAKDFEEEESFIALYAVLGVVGIGVGYLIFEFRVEILKLFCKVFRRVRS